MQSSDKHKEPVRIVDGFRILTEAQIAALSDAALDRYRRIVLAKQQRWHDSVTHFCCEMCRDVIYQERAVGEIAQRIRMFDYLARATAREKRCRALQPARAEKSRARVDHRQRCGRVNNRPSTSAAARAWFAARHGASKQAG